jgi:hypothetical protein
VRLRKQKGVEMARKTERIRRETKGEDEMKTGAVKERRTEAHEMRRVRLKSGK